MCMTAPPSQELWVARWAKLAGVPQDVIRNAKAQLAHLEGSASPSAPAPEHVHEPAPKAVKQPASAETVYQGDMFAMAEPSAVEEALQQLDVDGLSPRDALNQLYELRALLKK
jgi:Mismatch repair ATPase (MutS family)